MWDFSIAQTFSLIARTWPFLLLRLAVFAGVALLFFLVTGVGTLSGFALGNGLYGMESGLQYGIFGTIGGFIAASLIFRLLRAYILYMVKAAHIAVLVQLLDGNQLPPNTGQVAYGRQIVAERFTEANVLFAVDLLIKAVVRSIGKFLSATASFIPLPGLRSLIDFLRAVAENAVTFIDEIILAENMRAPGGNPWDVSRQALVLYAQNAKSMVKNAVWLTVFLALLTLLIFLVLVGPFVAAFAVVPEANSVFAIIAAGLAAVFVKETLFEPLAVVALMQVYTRVTRGQEPDPEWDRKLAEMSASFRDMKDKALATAAGATEEAVKNPWS